MKDEKINIKTLREACRKKDIKSIQELAEMVPCSRPAIYFALEIPTRYPRVFARIKDLTGL